LTDAVNASVGVTAAQRFGSNLAGNRRSLQG
jgi:hypothetical protein